MARQLQSLGFDAAALQGGYNAWRATYPVESKDGSKFAPLESQSDEVTSEPITFVE